MKTFLHLPKHFLQVCLLLLCINGCIKEPGPDIPLPPRKPAWLLTKFIQVRGYGDEVLGPVYGEYYYFKEVAEYRYNQYYKPVLRLSYYSAIDKDTASLRLYYTDTLMYDRLQRVTAVKQIYNIKNRVLSMKKFAYRGNDTLPYLIERYNYDSLGNPQFNYASRYEYQGDTTVLAIRQDPKGNDTVRYIYRQGNFASRCYSRHGYCEDVYTSYAGGPNVGLFLNLSHGLALEIPDTQESPRISRESWEQTSNPEYSARYLIFNEYGLPVMARWRSYIPEYVVTSRFEYMKVE
jgi:hypothetical protein